MSGNQNENSENEPETLEAYNLSFDPNSKSVSSFNERSKPVFLKPEDVELAWIDALARPVSSDEASLNLKEKKLRSNPELDDWMHDEAAFLLRFTEHSNSRLSPTQAFFEHLMVKFQISPRFYDFVQSFGFKEKEYDYSVPACKLRISPRVWASPYESITGLPNASNELLKLECLYGFRYAADNGTRDSGKDRWSIRQTAIYQSYDPRTNKFVWVGIGVSNDVENALRTYLNARSKTSVLDAFVLHADILDISIRDWRWLLSEITEKVEELNDSIALARVGDSALGLPKDFEIDFRHRQQLNLSQEKITNVRIALRSTMMTIESLQRHLLALAEILKLPSAAVAHINGTFQENLEQASIHLSRSEKLADKVKETATILSDLLSFNDTSSLREDSIAMRKMSEQAAEDSRSIKLITIITAIFLPATVTASFFSTQFVQVGDGNFQLERCVWVYFATTIVLTAVTMTAWALTYLIGMKGRKTERSPPNRSSNRTDEKSLEATDENTDILDESLQNVSQPAFITRLWRRMSSSTTPEREKLASESLQV